ncbi:hypothetical protein AgCh_023164 [Apium graveolens]
MNRTRAYGGVRSESDAESDAESDGGERQDGGEKLSVSVKMSRIFGYSKSMSKVLFGKLNSGNLADVHIGVTSYMSAIFKTYPLDKHLYFSLSTKLNLKSSDEQQTNPQIHGPSTLILD